MKDGQACRRRIQANIVHIRYLPTVLSTCTYFIANEAELGRFGGADVNIHNRTVLALFPSWLPPSWPYYDSC